MFYKNLPQFYHHHKPKPFKPDSNLVPHSYSRKPLEIDVLINVLKSKTVSYQSHNVIKRINTHKSLLTYLKENKNFEACLEYNYFEVENYPNNLNIVLLDTSFSMKKYNHEVEYLFREMDYDLILLHDQHIYECYDLFKNDFEYKGGTQYSEPVKKLIELTTKLDFKLNVLHLTDGEISLKDQVETEQLLIEFRNNNTYECYYFNHKRNL